MNWCRTCGASLSNPGTVAGECRACAAAGQPVCALCGAPLDDARWKTCPTCAQDDPPVERCQTCDRFVPRGTGLCDECRGAAQPPVGSGGSVGSKLIRGVVALGAVLVVSAVVIPNFTHHGCGGQTTACKSNLKNIGTALEMYAVDNHNRYPDSLKPLVGEYLKIIPTCPSIGASTYPQGYAVWHDPAGRPATPTPDVNSPQFDKYVAESTKYDRYTVVCAGANHAAVGDSANYPQYTSTQGLLEK